MANISGRLNNTCEDKWKKLHKFILYTRVWNLHNKSYGLQWELFVWVIFFFGMSHIFTIKMYAEVYFWFYPYCLWNIFWMLSCTFCLSLFTLPFPFGCSIIGFDFWHCFWNVICRLLLQSRDCCSSGPLKLWFSRTSVL